jgi:hypothetical protein
MPSRTFSIALKNTLDRKRRARNMRWHDLCAARMRDTDARNAKAEMIARSVVDRFTALSSRSREHIVRVLTRAIAVRIDEPQIFRPLSSAKRIRRR